MIEQGCGRKTTPLFYVSSAIPKNQTHCHPTLSKVSHHTEKGNTPWSNLKNQRHQRAHALPVQTNEHFFIASPITPFPKTDTEGGLWGEILKNYSRCSLVKRVGRIDRINK